MFYLRLNTLLILSVFIFSIRAYGGEISPAEITFAAQAKSIFDDEEMPIKERMDSILALANGQIDVVRASAYLYCLNLIAETDITKEMQQEMARLYSELAKIPNSERVITFKKLAQDFVEIAKDKIQNIADLVDEIRNNQDLYGRAYQALSSGYDYSINDLSQIIMAFPSTPFRDKFAVAIVELYRLKRQKSYRDLSAIAQTVLDAGISSNWCANFIRAIADNNEPEIIKLQEKIWRMKNLPVADRRNFLFNRLENITLKDLEAQRLPLFPLLSADEYDAWQAATQQVIRDKLIMTIAPTNDIFARALSILRQSPDKFMVKGKTYNGAEIADKMRIKHLVAQLSPVYRGDDLLFALYLASNPADQVIKIHDYSNKDKQLTVHLDQDGKMLELQKWLEPQLPLSPAEYEHIKKINKTNRINPENVSPDIGKNNKLDAHRQTLKNAPLSELVTQATLALFDEKFTPAELAEIKKLSALFSPEFVLLDLPTFMLRYYVNENLTPQKSNPTAQKSADIISRAIKLVEQSDKLFSLVDWIDATFAVEVPQYNGREIAAQMAVKRLILSKSAEFNKDENKVLELICQTSNENNSIKPCWVLDENGQPQKSLWYWLLAQLDLPLPDNAK